MLIVLLHIFLNNYLCSKKQTKKRILCPFFTGLVIFLLLMVRVFYIFYIHVLYRLANISPILWIVCSFSWCYPFYHRVFNLYEAQFIYFFSYCMFSWLVLLVSYLRNNCLTIFSSKNLMIFISSFSFMIHFELVYMNCVWKRYNFIL